MRKTLFIFAIFLVLSSMAVIAQNETNVTAPAGNVTAPAQNISAPPAAPPASNATRQPAARTAQPKETPTCGNGKVDAGENCFSCTKDVRCQSGQACNTEKGVCESQTNFTTYIIIGIGIIVLAGLFIFLKKIMKQREGQEDPALARAQAIKLQIAMPPTVSQTIPQQAPAAAQKPEAQRASQSLANNQKQQEPAPLMQGTMPAPEQQPAVQEQAQKKEEKPEQEIPMTEMPDEYNEHPGETMQQKFIRQMREKGWNDEKIRMKLKESGWSETQIALEFLKAPKFVKKS